MRIARLLLIALPLALAGSPAAGNAPAPSPVNDVIIACESAPAPDTGDVKIGTALRLHRGADAVEAGCADLSGRSV